MGVVPAFGGSGPSSRTLGTYMESSIFENKGRFISFVIRFYTWVLVDRSSQAGSILISPLTE